MKKLICVCLAFFMVLGITACGKEKQKFTDYSFDFFDTATSIIGYETNEEVFKANCEKIKDKLSQYHKLYTIYSRYNGVNNLNTLNNSKKQLEVDSKIIEMLLFSKEMYTLTNSKVNIAMGSVLSIWHDYRKEGLDDPYNAKIPQMSELKAAAEHTNIDDLIIENNTVFLKDPEMKLDVGAIAKGYAIEQTAMWLEEEGIEGYLLNVGGNIKIIGKRPDGKKWDIGLENPDTEDLQNPYIEYLELEEMSMVTSGSYQRYYTVKGINYHHIIDPDTLMPSTKYTMVTVINKNSAIADALSTALFCMDYEVGKKLIEALDNTYVMWVTAEGEKLYSKGFKELIK